MNEPPKKIKGLWWLPGKPDEKWVGTLKRGKRGSLRLKFTVPYAPFGKCPDTPDALHGVDSHNHPITLLFPAKNGGTSSAAFTKYCYSAGYAVQGLHLKGSDAIKLHRADLDLEYLHDFVNRSGFQKQTRRKTQDFSIHYKAPPKLSFRMDDGTKLELVTYTSSHNGSRAYEVEECSIMRMGYPKGASLKRIISDINLIRGMLHFSILRPVHLVRLLGRKNRQGKRYGNLYLHDDIEILSTLNQGKSSQCYQHASEFVFTFQDIEKDFPAFITKWRDYSTKQKNALSCYYGTFYHNAPLDENFLSLTRALDAYWGVKHQKRNDNNFPRKIRELATQHQTHLKLWIPNVDAFVQKVKATRHFHTHYGEKWEQSGDVISGVELTYLNAVLTMLFQICVLSDLGIPSSRFPRLHRQMPSKVIQYELED